MTAIEGLIGWLPALGAACALYLFVVGLGVIFKRKWARQELEVMRKAHQEADVTDPQNNTVRALYQSSVTDQHRWSASERLTRSSDSSGDGGGSAADGD
jgi:uncharacterized membrane protein